MDCVAPAPQYPLQKRPRHAGKIVTLPDFDWNAAGLGAVAVGLMVVTSKFVIQPTLRLLRPKTVNDVEAIRESVKELGDDLKAHRRESQEGMQALYGRVTDLAERVSFMEGQHSRQG